MRTFQFSDAKSHKFWTIDVSGAGFTVTYGKVGAAGQTQAKSFATPEKAQAEADKLVREKVGKGYVETTPKAAASDAEAFEKALLAAGPGDVAAWGAYADYLAERGDPRGEFMQVQLALEDEALAKKDRDALKKREKALLAAHERAWLGPLAPFTVDQPEAENRWEPRCEYRFRRGWLAELSFGRVGVEAVRALNKAAEARFLHTLGTSGAAYETPVGQRAPDYIDGRYEPGPDVPQEGGDHPALHVLARCPHLAAVRAFRLGNQPTADWEEPDQCHTDGDLAHHFVKQMPRLEELYLLAHRVDAAKLFALPLPALRVLMLYHGQKYPLDKLAANKSLTNLTHLLCHPHALEYDDEENEGAYIRLEHVRAICRSPHLTSLTHLRLRLSDFGDKGVAEIVGSGILKRLKVLDLQGGCVTDDGAAALAGCPDLANLESLNLTSNAMTDSGVKALAAVLGQRVAANHQHNHVPPFDDGETPEYLYEGDIE